MSSDTYKPEQQVQFVDEYATSDEEMGELDEMLDVDYGHAQYSVMNVTNK